jgi:magnesium transporter
MIDIIKTNDSQILHQMLVEICSAISAKDKQKIVGIFNYLNPKDGARILQLLNNSQRKQAIKLIGSSFKKEILEFLDDHTRSHIIQNVKYHFSSDKESLVPVDRQELIQQRVFQTIKAISELDYSKLQQIFNYLQSSDAATVIEFLTPPQRVQLIKLLGISFDPEILTYLDYTIRDEVVSKIEINALVHFLSELDESDIIEIIQHIDPSKQKSILDSISKIINKDTFRSIKKSLHYPQDTAGRIMNQGISLPSSCTVKNAYQKFCFHQKLSKENQIVYIYDQEQNTEFKFNLIGQIYLIDLCKLNQKRKTRNDVIGKHMVEIPCVAYTNTKLEEVGFLFKKYFVTEMPVVNPKNRRLMGVLNASQAVDILDTMSEETALTLAGLEEFDFFETTLNTITTRLKLLGIASMAVILSSLVIRIFEDVLAKNLILASITPIVAGISGNAASQVLTVTVRAISNREIGRSNLWRTIRKEVISGFGSGLIIGACIGLMIYIFTRNMKIAVILMVAITANTAWAGLIGTSIPILLNKHRKDPALASVFLNVLTDMVGYAILLGLASTFIR